MSRQFSIFVVFVTVPVLVAPSWADDGWRLPNLTSLKRDKKEPQAEKPDRIRAHLSDEPFTPGSSPLASMAREGQATHSPPRRDEPSVLNKLNEGTKDLFHSTLDTTKDAFARTKQALGKTKHVLMPWSLPKREVGGSSIFTPWWRPEKKPERPSSVKEFLALPRPGP